LRGPTPEALAHEGAQIGRDYAAGGARTRASASSGHIGMDGLCSTSCAKRLP
jgi:hypothetical protein